jgi:hypothetical protein
LSLCSIIGNLLLVKDGDGAIFWPKFNINQIINMQPGKGYQLYLEDPASLVYLVPNEPCPG